MNELSDYIERAELQPHFTTVSVQGEPLTTFPGSCPILVSSIETQFKKNKENIILITKLTEEPFSQKIFMQYYTKLPGRFVWLGETQKTCSKTIFNESHKLTIPHIQHKIQGRSLINTLGGFQVNGKKYLAQRTTAGLNVYEIKDNKSKLIFSKNLENYSKTIEIVCKKNKPDQIILYKNTKIYELYELKNNKLEFVKKIKIENFCQFISINELTYSISISRKNKKLKITPFEDENAPSWTIDLNESKFNKINRIGLTRQMRFHAEKSILSIMFKNKNTGLISLAKAFIERYQLDQSGSVKNVGTIVHPVAGSNGLGIFAGEAYFSHYDPKAKIWRTQSLELEKYTINQSDLDDTEFIDSNELNRKEAEEGEESAEVDTREVQTSSSTSSTSPILPPTTPPTDTLTHNPSLIPAAPSLFVLAGLGSLYLGYRGWKSFPKHSWKGLSYAAIPLLVGLGMERGLSTPSKKLLGISLLAIADLGLILHYSRSWHQRIDMLVALATTTAAMGGFAAHRSNHGN